MPFQRSLSPRRPLPGGSNPALTSPARRGKVRHRPLASRKGCITRSRISGVIMPPAYSTQHQLRDTCLPDELSLSLMRHTDKKVVGAAKTPVVLPRAIRHHGAQPRAHKLDALARYPVPLVVGSVRAVARGSDSVEPGIRVPEHVRPSAAAPVEQLDVLLHHESITTVKVDAAVCDVAC